MDRDCTEDDDDICQGYFCLNNQIVNGEGLECHINENGISPNCAISGMFCTPTQNVSYNHCMRSYDKPKPKVNYDYGVGHECVKHYYCHEGLYCAHKNAPLQPGTYEICLVDGDCPEKEEPLPNYPICKYGEYECPDRCGVLFGECIDDSDSASCCLGLKCQRGANSFKYHCVLDRCKKTGACYDDSECCDGYGCLNGKVVYAVGQECYSENGEASVNCTDRTACDIGTAKSCYRPNEEPRMIFNPIGRKDCLGDYDCDEGLYCDGKGRCSVCQVAEECPEKILPNISTCKPGEYNCPLGHICGRLGDFHVPVTTWLC